MSVLPDPLRRTTCETESDGRDDVLGQGVGSVVDGAGLAILDRAECFRLLADGCLGRIAINVGALPTILPVRYVLDGEQLIVRTGIGTTLDRATRGTVVAFETDGFGPSAPLMWSVSAVGIADHLTDAEPPAGVELRLPRWSGTAPPRFVSISTDHLSGRRMLS